MVSTVQMPTFGQKYNTPRNIFPLSSSPDLRTRQTSSLWNVFSNYFREYTNYIFILFFPFFFLIAPLSSFFPPLSLSDLPRFLRSSWQPQDCTISQRSELRKTVQVSPMPLPTVSGNLSSPAPYGTRLSTVLLVRNNGHVLFVERDIWQLGDGDVPFKSEPPTERKYNFKLEASAEQSHR